MTFATTWRVVWIRSNGLYGAGSMSRRYALATRPRRIGNTSNRTGCSVALHAPLPGRYAEASREGVREGALVCETHFERDVREGAS